MVQLLYTHDPIVTCTKSYSSTGSYLVGPHKDTDALPEAERARDPLVESDDALPAVRVRVDAPGHVGVAVGGVTP